MVNLLQRCDILITDSSNTLSHCGLCIREAAKVGEDYSSRATDIVHAQTKGLSTISISDWGDKSQIFRPASIKDDETVKIEQIAKKIKESASYGIGRAFFGSWGADSSFGKSARERLEKYKKRLDTHQGLLKNVFCAELVILAYQIALDEKHPLFIEKDAKHTLPKTLRNYLLERPTVWTEVGDYP